MFRRGVEKSAQEGCLRCSLGVNSRKLVYPGSIDESIVAILAACVCVRVTPPLRSGLEYLQQLLHGLAWNFVQTSTVPQGWVLLTIVPPAGQRFSLSCETSTCFLIWYRFMVQTDFVDPFLQAPPRGLTVMLTGEMDAIKFGTDIHVPNTMNCNNFGDPNCDTFHIEESSGQNFN